MACSACFIADGRVSRLLSSVMISASWARPSRPVSATRPNSARWARSALISCVALTDEKIPRSMQHQQGLLIGRFDRHEPHRWACHGLTDGGCIGSIIFRPFDIALYVARRHQTHGVTEPGDFTSPMMSGSAGFHADQASRKLAKEVDDPLAPQLTGDNDLARIIHAVHLEHVLGEINADGANLHMDDPLR